MEGKLFFVGSIQAEWDNRGKEGRESVGGLEAIPIWLEAIAITSYQGDKHRTHSMGVPGICTGEISTHRPG